MSRLIDVDKLNRKDVNCANVPMNFIDTAPTVEAIPKTDYENRLKADMVAMLTEIQSEIEKKSYYDTTIIGDYEDEVRIDLVELDDVNEVIQQKINSLK